MSNMKMLKSKTLQTPSMEEVEIELHRKYIRNHLDAAAPD